MAKKITKSSVEAEVEDYLCERVEALGGLCVKLRPPTGMGFPDRTVMLPGGIVAFVEVKRPRGGHLSPQQKRWLLDMKKIGLNAEIVQSQESVDTLIDVLTLLN